MKEFLSKKRVQMIYVVILALLLAYAAVRVGVASIGKKEEWLGRGMVVTNIIALLALGGLIVAFLPKGFDRLLENDKTAFTFGVMLLFLAVTALLAFFADTLIKSKNEYEWNTVDVAERLIFFVFQVTVVQSILYFSFRNKPGLYLAVLWIVLFLPLFFQSLFYSLEMLGAILEGIGIDIFHSSSVLNVISYFESYSSFLDPYSSLLSFILAVVGLVTFIRKRKQLQGRDLSRKILQTSLIWFFVITLLPIAIVLIILSFFLGDSASGILVLFFQE